MNPAAILSAVTTAITIAKQFIEIGKDVAPIITSVSELLSKGRNVTEDDLQALQDQSDAWSSELQQPIPPEED